jgi:uncharacterized membrane protein YcaP (DUF421 family)
VPSQEWSENVKDVFFKDWQTLTRTAVIGVFAYACLILFVRVSGKRTLSKRNAFDFVVTVALPSARRVRRNWRRRRRSS